MKKSTLHLLFILVVFIVCFTFLGLAMLNEKPNQSLISGILTHDIKKVHQSLMNGADPTKPEIDGQTPLHILAKVSRNDVFQLVLPYINQVDVQNSKGQTPFMLAAIAQNYEILESLLSLDPDLSLKDEHGKNVFDYTNAKTTEFIKIQIIQNEKESPSFSSKVSTIIRNEEKLWKPSKPNDGRFPSGINSSDKSGDTILIEQAEIVIPEAQKNKDQEIEISGSNRFDINLNDHEFDKIRIEILSGKKKLGKTYLAAGVFTKEGLNLLGKFFSKGTSEKDKESFLSPLEKGIIDIDIICQQAATENEKTNQEALNISKGFPYKGYKNWSKTFDTQGLVSGELSLLIKNQDLYYQTDISIKVFGIKNKALPIGVGNPKPQKKNKSGFAYSHDLDPLDLREFWGVQIFATSNLDRALKELYYYQIILNQEVYLLTMQETIPYKICIGQFSTKKRALNKSKEIRHTYKNLDGQEDHLAMAFLRKYPKANFRQLYH